MTDLLEVAERHAARHADAHGCAPTGVAGLFIMRVPAPTGLVHAVSRPLACLVLQGSKRVAIGTDSFAFGAGDSLLVTADVPTVSQITDANPAAPYLSLVLELDAGVIGELAGPDGAMPLPLTDAVRVDATDADVADAAGRLLRLLDRPAALPVLGRQLVRELHYWLLCGRHGPAIRRLGLPDSHAGRIGRAVELLRAQFAQPVSIEALTATAGMSASSLHQHFRAVTSLSPLQFQKQLRLIEAKRLMTAEGASAGSAAFAVGYESVPQFTREYRRFFGESPARDAAAARRWALAA